jgi:N-acetyldiaminopimelate deacetylase
MDYRQFITIRRELHQIPELGFEEWKTQELLLAQITKLPQQFLQVDTWKTGIFVLVEGSQATKIIAYRADIDGLPMEEETNLAFKSKHAGKMHGCGHDFHMSIALGVLTFFCFKPTKRNFVIYFPTC